MKTALTCLAICTALGFGTLAALPAHAQTYNQHLDTTWQSGIVTRCTTTGSCVSGINGLTYYDEDAGTSNDFASAAVVQPDGKLLVAGSILPSGGDRYFEVHRYLPDGTLDASFGVDGIARGGAVQSDVTLHSIVVGPDGSIYVGGELHDKSNDTHEGIVRRLTMTGGIDYAYGVGIGDNVTQLLMDGDNVIAIGSQLHPGYTDADFMAAEITPDGFTITDIADTGIATGGFNLGGDNNDRASSGVLESFETYTGSFPFGTVHENKELYVVGAADTDPWPAGATHAECAIAAYRSTDGGPWVLDTGFDGDGKLSFDSLLSIPGIGFTTDETLCYAGQAQPQSISPFTGIKTLSGIVVGGERYYDSAGLSFAYDTSAFLLGKVSSDGAWTQLAGVSTDSQYISTSAPSGTYNSIRGIVRQYQGKYLVAGLAGTTEFHNAPSDMGTLMIDGSFNRDPSWGTGGVDLLSLDGAIQSCIIGCSTFPAAKEAAGALALDPWRGKAYVVGDRDNSGIGSGDDWLIGVVRVSDRIFASNFAATSPND